MGNERNDVKRERCKSKTVQKREKMRITGQKQEIDTERKGLKHLKRYIKQRNHGNSEGLYELCAREMKREVHKKERRKAG